MTAREQSRDLELMGEMISKMKPHRDGLEDESIGITREAKIMQKYIAEMRRRVNAHNDMRDIEAGPQRPVNAAEDPNYLPQKRHRHYCNECKRDGHCWDCCRNNRNRVDEYNKICEFCKRRNHSK